MNLAEWIAGDVGVIVLALTLIQIAPIKVNPWSAMMRAVGKALNTAVVDEMERNRADEARRRIILLDDELRHTSIRHTEERFEQALDDIDLYDRYCKAHPEYPNHKGVCAKENVERVYRKCRDENDFLK